MCPLCVRAVWILRLRPHLLLSSPIHLLTSLHFAPTGDIHPLPPHLILSRASTDLHFHVVGPLATSNELMLQSALTAFHDSVSLLLRGQIEKRNVLESLDLVLLAADETIDDG